MSKRVFILSHSEARRRAVQSCQDAPEGFVVTVAEPTRTLEQNARLWACLGDIAGQVEWSEQVAA